MEIAGSWKMQPLPRREPGLCPSQPQARSILLPCYLQVKDPAGILGCSQPGAQIPWEILEFHPKSAMLVKLRRHHSHLQHLHWEWDEQSTVGHSQHPHRSRGGFLLPHPIPGTGQECGCSQSTARLMSGCSLIFFPAGEKQESASLGLG